MKSKKMSDADISNKSFNSIEEIKNCLKIYDLNAQELDLTSSGA